MIHINPSSDTDTSSPDSFLIAKAGAKYADLLNLAKELWRGKSIYRAFLNSFLISLHLTGEILDLGSSSSSASYHRAIKYTEPYKITYTDFYKNGPDILHLNLEDKFAIEDNAYGTITCFNVIEHVYDFRNMLSESFRILKPGGVFIGSAPLMYRYHADPHDYFRFTHEAIYRIFREQGFEFIKMQSIGYGPYTTALNSRIVFMPAWFRLLLLPCAVIKDLILRRLRPNYGKQDVMAYAFIFRKPDNI